MQGYRRTEEYDERDVRKKKHVFISEKWKWRGDIIAVY